MLSAEWLLAIVGICSVYWRADRSRIGRVIIYLGMGWLFLAALGPIIASFPAALLPWLISGGVCYSVGAVIFLIDWPPLWKGLFSAHDFWHVLVLGGSTCHFVMIAQIVNFSAVSAM